MLTGIGLHGDAIETGGGGAIDIDGGAGGRGDEIGRASCRERVLLGV